MFQWKEDNSYWQANGPSVFQSVSMGERHSLLTGAWPQSYLCMKDWEDNLPLLWYLDFWNQWMEIKPTSRRKVKSVTMVLQWIFFCPNPILWSYETCPTLVRPRDISYCPANSIHYRRPPYSPEGLPYGPRGLPYSSTAYPDFKNSIPKVYSVHRLQIQHTYGTQHTEWRADKPIGAEPKSILQRKYREKPNSDAECKYLIYSGITSDEGRGTRRALCWVEPDKLAWKGGLRTAFPSLDMKMKKMKNKVFWEKTMTNTVKMGIAKRDNQRHCKMGFALKCCVW